MNKKFRIAYWAQDGSLSYQKNDKILIGLNGQIYENYGENFKNPMWEIPFDVSKRPIIQQYSGINDKNEVEIYEDDIVLFKNKKYSVNLGHYYSGYESRDSHCGFFLKASRNSNDDLWDIPLDGIYTKSIDLEIIT